MASTGNQVSEAWHSHSKNEVDLCAQGKNHLGGVIIRGEKLDWRMGFRRQPHEQEPRGRRATIMDELRQSRKRWWMSPPIRSEGVSEGRVMRREALLWCCSLHTETGGGGN